MRDDSQSLWRLNAEFQAAWGAFPDVLHSKLKKPDRLFVLYQLARSVADQAGNTVECGVWQGASSFVLCKATQPAVGRTHHVVDSCAGLSAPSAQDGQHWAAGTFASPETVIRKNLLPFSVQYHTGWIPEVFKTGFEDRRLIFVHIDVDLAQPTWDSLSFLYERVLSGGIILSDDYGSPLCPGARWAFDRFMADKREKIVELPTAQAFIIKR